MFGRCWLLCVVDVCCLMSVAGWLPFAGNCSLFVVRCSLFAVWQLVFVVICRCALFVACSVLCVVVLLLFVVCGG